MTAKTETKTLAAAMALAFGEIDAATKGAENPAFKRDGKALKYADINSVIDAIKPALINHGLFFTQHPSPHERGVQIETFLHHTSGEEMSLGTLFVPANKQDAHGFGSALTYARRYALVTAFGVPVEDDDGNAAASAPPKAKTQDDFAPAKASDADITMIQQLITATKADVGAILKAAKVDALPDMTPAQAGKVIERLQNKLADMAKAQSDSIQAVDELADDAAFLKGE